MIVSDATARQRSSISCLQRHTGSAARRRRQLHPRPRVFEQAFSMSSSVQLAEADPTFKA